MESRRVMMVHGDWTAGVSSGRGGRSEFHVRRRRRTLRARGGPTLLVALWAALTPVTAVAEPPHISAKAYLAHDAVKPGGETEVAVEVTVEKGWHIYHRIVLDTGAPTEFTFDAPPGVTVGDVRFPTPEEGETTGLKYLEHHGKPVFVAPVRVAATAKPGETLTIGVKVRALACKESCVFNDATASVAIPVKAAMGTPANKEIFAAAREKLAPPLAEAPRIKGSELIVSQDRVRLGDSFELALAVNVEKGGHVQDRDPGVEGLIPARLYVQSVAGFESAADETKFPGGQIWPAPKSVNIPGFGRVNQQDGRFVVRVPLKLTDPEMKPGPVTVHALFSYQVCTASGQCFPPVTAEGSVMVEITPPGSPVKKSSHAAFSAAGLRDSPATSAEPSAPSAAKRDDRDGETTAGGAADEAVQPLGEPGRERGLWWWYLLAFCGGAVLNIMPCVLPVISLKIFSFMRQAGEDRRRVLMMGVVYCAGIMASFLILAIVMVAIRAAAGGVAWGTLMQQPAYVIALAAVMCAFALSLFGVYEITLPGSAAGALDEAASREGYAGSFFNGVLATALATPCTAPMLGPALGVLTQLSSTVMVSGIVAVGAGMAAPYLLLTAFPAWLKFMPKPGNWMVAFKQFMGFVLLGTVVWLFYILSYLVGPVTVIATLAFLCFIGLACWLYGTIDLNAGAVRRMATYAAILLVLGGGWGFSFRWLAAGDEATTVNAGSAPVDDSELRAIADDIIRRSAAISTQPGAEPPERPWDAWKRGLPELLSQRGYTVYVDFTAKWCLTCQTNKRLTLHTGSIQKKLHDMNVICLLGDFTRYDKDIQKELTRFGRAGVPVNLVIPGGQPNRPILLPEVLTPGIVSEALDKAGPSRPM